MFSNNPDDDLFSVRFTLVGDNLGNYIVSSINAISTIYEYVAPIAGTPQGNFAPIVQLVAPNKLQMAVLNGNYAPTQKTNIGFEVAGSKNDLNLFIKDSSYYQLNFNHINKKFNTRDFYFVSSKTSGNGNVTAVSFKLLAENNPSKFIEFQYLIPAAGYKLDFNINIFYIFIT